MFLIFEYSDVFTSVNRLQKCKHTFGEMDPSRRQRTQTKATAEEQALDQIARELGQLRVNRAGGWRGFVPTGSEGDSGVNDRHSFVCDRERTYLASVNFPQLHKTNRRNVFLNFG
ncbi:unnamed protein product [Leptosia nina]|uniref:Uncharacterized protein n=1 Tax=Leptosia nina TaxID=320188 RepID=A0AAV1JX27_9NEOP